MLGIEAQTSIDLVSVGANGLLAYSFGSGDRSAASWQSADGRDWRPLASTGASNASPAVTSLISDDGVNIVSVGSDDSSALAFLVSVDGATWTKPTSIGLPSDVPSLTGAGANTFDRAFVLPGGVLVLCQNNNSQRFTVWLLTARD